MIDTKQFDDFARKFNQLATSDIKTQLLKLLEHSGKTFLNLVEEHLRGSQRSNTDELLKSFKKGGNHNVWTMDASGSNIQIEVGSELEYASFVNDGHWQEARWVPGIWSGNTFQYEAGAKTGMMLKAQFVEGEHYWDAALLAYEAIFEREAEQMMQIWFDKLSIGR